MHRIGAIGGQLIHVKSRLYNEVGNHPDIFKWAEPCVYEILSGAEIFLPISTRDLIALANGEPMDDPIEAHGLINN